MYLAQGIKKRYELEKLKDSENNKVSPLTYLIDLEYKKYKELCFWTYQKPLSKGKWLLQQIEEAEK